MAYRLITEFIYEVGEGVGEFLNDDEKAVFKRIELDEIVRG